jgi:hypothetical protein
VWQEWNGISDCCNNHRAQYPGLPNVNVSLTLQHKNRTRAEQELTDDTHTLKYSTMECDKNPQ